MINSFSFDSRTVFVNAFVRGLAFNTLNRSAANGAFCRKVENLFSAGAKFLECLFNVGYHIAGAADNNSIPHPYIKPAYFIFVMQGRAAYGSTADFHRFKNGYRSQDAR